MPKFADISIKSKVTAITLLTSCIAVLLACAIFVAGDLWIVRKTILSELAAIADIVGRNSAAAILFDDRPAAEETLSALSAKSNIVAGSILSGDGEVFATYASPDHSKQQSQAVGLEADQYHSEENSDRLTEQHSVHGGFLDQEVSVSQPIVLDGEKIGTVLLVSDLGDLYKHINLAGLVAIIASCISLSLAVFLSAQLQHVIYQPILNLANTMKSVAEKRSFSIRATKISKDELGDLTDGFNAMLAEIESHEESVRIHQRELEYQALHDALTGLPNRSLLADRLEGALLRAQRDKKPIALLLLDLDQFKEVNDTLGHHVGDELLKEVAGRCVSAVRKSDTVARLGGDEFLVLLPAVADRARAQEVAGRIVKALQCPFQIDSLTFEVGVSVGIALYPDHADDSARLIQCADVAMYAAKNNNLHISIYDRDKDSHSVRYLALSAELRRAIREDTLNFHYQPKVDLRLRRICGVEALVRWEHPEHGYIMPDELVRLAERTGLIHELTDWGLNTALSQIAKWEEAGLVIGVAVNLSALNFAEEDLPEKVRALLDKWRVEPNRLTLEITESAIMHDPIQALEIARQLDQIGVCLSIDDFGTGYSSLANLKRLPVDELKIDRTFIMNMIEDESDATIARSTIDLGHNLGLQVVAEGIESAQHIGRLREFGCDIGQGFFIGRPMPADRFMEWLRDSEYRPAEIVVPDQAETETQLYG